MHAFSLTTLIAVIATFASAAPLEVRDAAFTAPTGTGPFQLEVIATGGNLSYSGFFLGTYHTGAGLNALVASDGQTGAQTYNYTKKSGDVTATLGAYPYYLTLTSSNLFAPPKGYNFFGFNIGGAPNSNLSFSQPGNYLQFAPGDNYTAAVCPAQIYSKGVFVPTLVWREAGAKKLAKCADVLVKAIF